jgi:hypothetical protein
VRRWRLALVYSNTRHSTSNMDIQGALGGEAAPIGSGWASEMQCFKAQKVQRFIRFAYRLRLGIPLPRPSLHSTRTSPSTSMSLSSTKPTPPSEHAACACSCSSTNTPALSRHCAGVSTPTAVPRGLGAALIGCHLVLCHVSRPSNTAARAHRWERRGQQLRHPAGLC